MLLLEGYDEVDSELDAATCYRGGQRDQLGVYFHKTLHLSVAHSAFIEWMNQEPSLRRMISITKLDRRPEGVWMAQSRQDQ